MSDSIGSGAFFQDPNMRAVLFEQGQKSFKFEPGLVGVPLQFALKLAGDELFDPVWFVSEFLVPVLAKVTRLAVAEIKSYSDAEKAEFAHWLDVYEYNPGSVESYESSPVKSLFMLLTAAVKFPVSADNWDSPFKEPSKGKPDRPASVLMHRLMDESLTPWHKELIYLQIDSDKHRIGCNGLMDKGRWDLAAIFASAATYGASSVSWRVEFAKSFKSVLKLYSDFVTRWSDKMV